MTRQQGRALLALLLALPACTKEARLLASDQPQTRPNGPADARASAYDGNVYQVSQGARYFTWYGCGACHRPDAKGAPDLADAVWRHGGTIDQVYTFISDWHPPQPYGAHIPVEQIWQMAAYVRSLPQTDPVRTRRQTLDQQGEPQGAVWTGPVG